MKAEVKKRTAGKKKPPTPEITDSLKYFLPYQVEWLRNDAPVKIWEKSRRIGATYVQAFEDVFDCVTGKVPAVWFSSADESAAREYIEYCVMWTRVFQVIADQGEETVVEAEKEIKVFSIRFANGKRINALSSNPKAFRSKGGKVVLDEFAFHRDAKALWDAAQPATTWDFPIRILSTHNGKGCLYYRHLEKAEENGWWKYTTTIQMAVDQGLADKIAGRALTREEREKWLDDLKRKTGDIHTWNQEYCCIPVDETTAFLTFDMIASAENPSCRHALNATAADVKNWTVPADQLYLGMDIGRKKDLSVIWLAKEEAGFILTLGVWVLEKAPFHMQKSLLYSLLDLPQVRRACIDETGMGIQLAEEARLAYGSKVEPVWFTPRVKEEMAYQLYRKFEDRHIAIPPHDDIRQDLHSIQKITTAAGNIRFDQSNDTSVMGHADRFWALALMVHAATNGGPAFIPVTAGKRQTEKLMKGYF